MFRNLFKNFFTKPSFGLDISDESIKFVKLIDTKDGVNFIGHGEITLPFGIIESGEIKDSKKLEKILNSPRKNFGLKFAHISLPADAENIKAYHSVFKNSGIKVISLEPKIEAVSRAILKRGDRGTHMIVYISNAQNNIAVVSNDAIISIMRVSDAVHLLTDEVANYFLRWHAHKEQDKKRPAIKNIILCGGGPQATQLSEYLSVGMRNKVMLASVWMNITVSQNQIPEIHLDQSFDFAPAFGLALKGFYR